MEPFTTQYEARATSGYVQRIRAHLSRVPQARVEVDLPRGFVYVHPRKAPVLTQGWKLHVSASVPSAVQVLEACMPALLEMAVPFKVVASEEILREMNAPSDPRALGQVGKFITVYPVDEDQAVELARVLDAATSEFCGPVIPSDRPLRRGSLVHYRFGAFGSEHVQTPLGEVVPILTSPDGLTEPDQRRVPYASPSWVDDPFVRAGLAGDVDEKRLIGERYLILALLAYTARGKVMLAIDLEDPRRIVLKQAARGALARSAGSTAQDWLRHEHAVLQALGGTACVPSVHDLVASHGELFLPMDDLGGRSLERFVAERARGGEMLRDEEVVELGCQLAVVLDHVHVAGFAYRDIKSTNMLLGDDGTCRIVDFECAARLGTFDEAQPLGTRGYMSPQQRAGALASVRDDVYGLGALLYFLVTGAEPSLAPDPLDLQTRGIGQLRPGVGERLAQVVTTCLSPEPSGRYASMAEVQDQLREAIRESKETPAQAARYQAPRDRERCAPPEARRLCGAMAEYLAEAAVEPPSGSGLGWESRHPVARGWLSHNLNAGSPGAALVLAHLQGALRRPAYEGVLVRASEHLVDPPRLAGERSAGLYVGRAGVALSLLRIGQVLDDAEIIERAVVASRAIAEAPHVSPDLFNGSAGRALLHMIVADHTGEKADADLARACGDHLVTAARMDRGHASWPIPDGFGSMSGKAHLGYAHGAAGIGDVLLDLFELTDDDRYLGTSTAAARALTDAVLPMGSDGVEWPIAPGEDVFGPNWCHGSAGIGRFMTHLARVTGDADALRLARGAARTVASTARGANPTLCHGLAGRIELILDLYQLTGECEFRAAAADLGGLLVAFLTERGRGMACSSESPDVITPGYLLGSAGVAACLLRLSEPGGSAHLMSRAGFARPPTRYRGDTECGDVLRDS